MAQEIDLSNSKFADPSTRMRRGHWTRPDVIVDGTVMTSEKEVSWAILLVDPKTGEVIGGDKGRVKADAFLQSTAAIAQRLAGLVLAWWHRRHRLRNKGGKSASSHRPKPPRKPARKRPHSQAKPRPLVS
jgi:hypothetical protein